MSTYAWLICEDLYDTDPAESAVGVIGPHDAPDALIERLRAGEGCHFRLCDEGDAELPYIYAGRLVSIDPEDEKIRVENREINGRQVPLVVQSPDSEEAAFGPLYDFGAPNFGCTEILYKDSSSNRYGSL